MFCAHRSCISWSDVFLCIPTSAKLTFLFSSVRKNPGYLVVMSVSNRLKILRSSGSSRGTRCTLETRRSSGTLRLAEDHLFSQNPNIPLLHPKRRVALQLFPSFVGVTDFNQTQTQKVCKGIKISILKVLVCSG